MSRSTEPVQPLVDGAGYFRLSIWRSLLTKAAVATGGPCDAICPFGFELSGDIEWLKRPVNRFYVLVGGDIPGPAQARAIGRRFAGHLMDLLSITDPGFCKQIAFIRINRTRNFRLKESTYVASESDALLSVLTLNDKRGALSAYTDYLISLVACSTFCHGEFTFFDRFPRVRRRLIQLTYMTIWIAEGLGLPLALTKPTSTFSQLYKTELRDFYAGNFKKPPSDDETAFLENVAKPVFTSFRNYLHERSATHPYTFEAEDLFSGNRVSATLSIGDYERLFNFVKQSYLSYTEPLSLPKTSSA